MSKKAVFKNSIFKSSVFKNQAVLIIGFSILAAVVMLLSSVLIEDAELSKQVMFWIIAAWFVPFSYLSAVAGKKPREETENDIG